MITKTKGYGTKEYHCDSCGESWVGVTNRVASQPLDSKAAACADKEVYAACPRLTGADGSTRPLTFSDDDYLCRRKWMDAYLTCSGAPPVVDPPPSVKDPPVTKCPEAPTVPADVKCAFIEMWAKCEHRPEGGSSRFAAEGMTLEVVPSTYGSDTITLIGNVQKPCGKHPQWTISENGTKSGESTSFDASGPVVQKFEFWLPGVYPRRYTVTCSSCHGDASLKVHAYPPNGFAFNLNAKSKGAMKIINKILHVAEKALDAVAGNFQWKWLEGKGNVEGGWKEYKDYRAYYGYKFDVNLTPLIGGEFEFDLDPLKIFKIVEKIPGIGKYVKRAADWLAEAKLYVKISGGITCEMKCERTSPDQPKFVFAPGHMESTEDGPLWVEPGVGGKVELAVGAKGGLLGDEDGVVSVELEASGALNGAGKPFMEDEGWGLDDFKIELEAVKGTFKLNLLWGLVDIDPSVTLISAPDSPLYGPTKWVIYKNEEPEEGGGGKD